MLYQNCVGTGTNGEIILMHGLGEHCARHTKMIDQLIKEGYTVCTFDLPGHGKSTGKRGCTTIAQGVSIIDDLIEQRKSRPFLLGYSLGALAALRYGECYPRKIAGIIASAPPLARRAGLSRFSVGLARFLAAIAPTLTVNNTIDPAELSRNTEAVCRYCDDPLVHNRISAALAWSLFVEMHNAHQKAHCISAPVLILSGTADTLSPLAGIEQFMHELLIKDKQLRVFPKSCHEIFEDPEWGDTFFETVTDWLAQHSSAAGNTTSSNNINS